MNIGVVGWWSYDNQGDLAMLRALRFSLAPHRIIPLDCGISINADHLRRLNRLDWVILGGGTLLPGKPIEPFASFDRWQDKLCCPLGVVGLGVNPILPQHRRAVEALVERAAFFYVRDWRSAELVGSPRAEVAPDLTFAHSPVARAVQCRRIEGAPVCGVNLRRTLTLNPQPWVETLRRLPVEIRGIPLSSFDLWHEQAILKQLDPRTPDHFTPELYQPLHLMVGTALHSVVFAVQAAVPVIAINYSPKVENFMTDLGLERYLLHEDEWGRLPAMVEEVIAEREGIQEKLAFMGERLRHDARCMIATISGHMEQRCEQHCGRGPQVSVVVLGSGDPRRDALTLNSCIEQTYENVEVLYCVDAEAAGIAESARITLVRTPSSPGHGVRLQRALRQASGELVTWLQGGDRLAADALDCQAARLQDVPGCDLVYADYWVTDERGRLIGRHWVPGPDKLWRRNIVGPCFLLRRTLLDKAGSLNMDSPLAAYSLWLRASGRSALQPFHAPLMYTTAISRQPEDASTERAARRAWRKDRPRMVRSLWDFIDSEFGERFIVHPVASLMREVRGRVLSDAEPS